MKVSETAYTLAIVIEDGTQYDISDFAEDLAWEEPEKELATSISFTCVTGNLKLSSILKLGCIAAVLSKGKEVARGTINRVRQKETSEGVKRTVLAYDELYPLQMSEDQLYFPAGQTTKAVLTQIFNDWSIPLGKYEGADVEHEKLLYRSGSLSEIILDILDDAVKKGGPPSLLRASGGKVEVIEKGSNKIIYLFDADDTASVEQESSITDLITRVKVVGKEDQTTGLPPVEAVLNGMTEFGVRQRIYNREKDATTEEAQKAAQVILDEKGKPKSSLIIKSPDVPEMRKGDMIFVHYAEIIGYFYVDGIHHDANSGYMTLQISQSPTFDSVIDYLAEIGVINSPDYWKAHADDTPYVKGLIEKAAGLITTAGTRCSTVKEGIDALVAAGIITTPAYWENKGGNVGELLKALGGAVKASGGKIT